MERKAACPLCVHEEEAERILSFRCIEERLVRFAFTKKKRSGF